MAVSLRKRGIAIEHHALSQKKRHREHREKKEEQYRPPLLSETG